MIAALFVQSDGCYAGLPGVEVWDERRDARTYDGPWRVIAHPPCERWGRFWHGSPNKPHQYRLGDDGGCFAAALAAVRKWGGVLEHPADSRAWDAFGLMKPNRCGGWIRSDEGWSCYVEQGWYGHYGRKPTWLYACGFLPPSLRWGRGAQRLDPIALERYGYEKARRSGMTGRIGVKYKKQIRGATPVAFRDLLIAMVKKDPPDREGQGVRVGG